MDRDDRNLHKRARQLVLATTLIRDACETRLEIRFKQDLLSVQLYEHYYSKSCVILYFLLTIINLSTIILEYPGNIWINGKPVPYYIPLVINLLCECYFYYRWYIIYVMSEKKTLKSNISFIATITILSLMTIDAIIYIIFHELNFSSPVRWSRALRPVLLLTFPENRRLRAAFFNLRRTLVDVLPVFGEFVIKTIVKRKEKLDEAFNLISTLTPDGQLGVSHNTFLHVMHIVHPKHSKDSLKVIFHVLDKNKSGYLLKHEFERLSEYMQAKFEEIELSRTYFNTYISKFYHIYTSTFLIEYDSQQSKFELYINERLNDLEMNAENELKKRGLENFRKSGFIISKKLLDEAGITEQNTQKVFYLKTDNASIEILMFRMFEKEIEELVEDLTNKLTAPKLKAHDPFSHL
ncbi:hypothetical protein Smp_079600 [Schistosoma mansoni]|uniref:hypothetical protein n=1 Tax=Schistosoma mansoni TaxID=6183 RepID=UPI00019B36C1|nr:hypothetical protein Smp_079600 [Schistosoma mansoni]|eukprot:XP_018648908.1 hypothetical protein Smp_079600 [Schistosoma mansoni]